MNETNQQNQVNKLTKYGLRLSGKNNVCKKMAV